ncbi:MAG: ATP-binding cassette domain-containing protein, partial [Mesorhizobium sp.]
MTEAAGPMLVCDGVVKRFGSLAAVDGVSMVVNPGEIVGIGGPNGAGKTTFFDVVTGITSASA